jgi:hypothetical protein
MVDQSRFTRFRAVFDSALRAYKEKTGLTLAEHSLAMQLQSCTSVESITTLIQDQIRASSDFGGTDRIMDSIGSTISILSTVSATAAFDWAINMVRKEVLTTRVTSLILVCSHSHLKTQYTLDLQSCLLYVSL